MQDDDYAQQLFEILTADAPADDSLAPLRQRIDRSTGFGRDQWVQSVEVVDGEHGAELRIVFGLRAPPDPQWRGLPQQGSVQVPLDEEWRVLSGFAEPAAYAPSVVREVDAAARRVIERHQRGLPPTPSADEVPPQPAGSEKAQWQLLLQTLDGEGEAQEVAPGRIRLVEADSGGTVVFVVRPEQWQQVYVRHARGDLDLYFADLLGPRQDDETYVVFYRGRLVRSTRVELPPVRGSAFERRVAEARRKNPGAAFGWYAYTPIRANEDDADTD